MKNNGDSLKNHTIWLGKKYQNESYEVIISNTAWKHVNYTVSLHLYGYHTFIEKLIPMYIITVMFKKFVLFFLTFMKIDFIIKKKVWKYSGYDKRKNKILLITFHAYHNDFLCFKKIFDLHFISRKISDTKMYILNSIVRHFSGTSAKSTKPIIFRPEVC